MNKIMLLFLFIAAIFTSTFLYYGSIPEKLLQETIAQFPIDDQIKFHKKETTIQLIDLNDEDEYTIEWKTFSEVKEKTDASHDISLLFEDGILKETLSTAKENSSTLAQKAKIRGEDSGHYEAISFHYGQFHYPNDVTTSIQAMSYDQLYILDSPLSPLQFFKKAKKPSEEEGQRILDLIVHQNLGYTWRELIDYFNINSKNYHLVPLTNLYEYEQTNFPMTTTLDTKQLLAQTWELVYKHYFVGIEKHDQTIESPIGSTVPLILYHKTYSHILMVFSSENGAKYNIVKNTGRF